jgi:tRNA dimethylallyltransferase
LTSKARHTFSETAIWLLTGPTASGKSALGLDLAQRIGGEIVNADSMQLYRDLRVLTARPLPHHETRVPHHLYGVADGAEAWSVGRWLKACRAALAEIASRGRPAVVVGGTGLYFAALTDGLADIPPIPAEIRAHVQSTYDAIGESAFRARLAQTDPATLGRIAPGDRQRLTRAMEVQAATGISITDWRKSTVPTLAPGTWRGLRTDPDRSTLYRRIDDRLAAMTHDGALEEVAALIERRLDPALPVMKAIGVAAFSDQLAGGLSAEDALARAQAETRRYAKRQLTWFRQRMSDWPIGDWTPDLVQAAITET